MKSKNYNKNSQKQFLFQVTNVLEKLGIEFFLSFGTLLGAMREGNFITGDNDIDIGVRGNIFGRNPKLWYKVVKELDKYGIKPNIIWMAHSSTNIVNREAIPMDIYAHQKRENCYYIDLHGWSYYFPEEFIDILDEIEFLGRKFKVPHNPKKYLEFLYGKDWNIPKSNFKGSKNKIITRRYKVVRYIGLMPLYKEI